MPNSGKRKLSKALANQQFEQSKKAKLEAAKESPSKGKVQVERRGWIPFNVQQDVLLVGEGNFSFAGSLVRHHFQGDGSRVVATAFDSEEVANSKYPDIGVHLQELRANGSEILFNVDCTRLNATKELKGRKFDRIVFNYPHVGAGEKDETRNIALNQSLLLAFFRSAATFLHSGELPTGQEKSSQHMSTSAIAEDADEKETVPDAEDALNTTSRANATSRLRGSIIITLRDCKPYTEWQLPLLAKKGRLFCTSKAIEQPAYAVIRSGNFQATDYPGYSHRRTIGYKEGISTDANEDTRLPAKQRKKTASPAATVTQSKIWQFALKDADES